MKSMIYAMKERIGDPSLFCGRQQEFDILMRWLAWIPKEGSKSRALLGRRKSGKTAIMQRIYNILWTEHGQIVPFYFEVDDKKVWLHDFAMDYFCSFLTQFFCFIGQMPLPDKRHFFKLEELEKLADELNMPEIKKNIDAFLEHYHRIDSDLSADYAFSTPHNMAKRYDLRVLVMIDEIQYMTKYVYGDKEKERIQLDRLPGAFHGLSESKIAPMLVSGSYVGWMSRMTSEMFVGGRLKWTPISPKLAPAEGLEAVYRYAEFYQQPVTEESAVTMNELTQSDPYYISCLFTSDYPERDLFTPEGVIATLNHEIETESSELRRTWSEYIDSTLRDVNDIQAKKILLLLSRERYKELTRREINDTLNLNMTDKELERKLEALIYGDLIGRGRSHFRYKGIPDDILDRIFRHRYQDEIEHNLPELEQEMTNQMTELERKYNSLLGKYRELKGRMLEFLIHRELQRYARRRQAIPNFRARFRVRKFSKLPNSEEAIEAKLSQFEEKIYREVGIRFYFQIQAGVNSEVDVLAEGWDDDNYWAILFEVKNRDKQKPTMDEAEILVDKVARYQAWIEVRHSLTVEMCGVYFSANGFDEDVESWLHSQGVLTADAESWEVE